MSSGSERTLNRALLLGTLVEVVGLVRLFRGDSILENHPFADDDALRSKSFRRLMVLFTSILGASRLLTWYYNRERSVWSLTLFIHLVECWFFYSEGWSSDAGADPKGRVLLSVLPGIPALLLINGPASSG